VQRPAPRFALALQQAILIGMSTMPSLWSTRLVLRPFTVYDAPDVERLAGAWEVADATLTIPHPYPAGGAAAWIATHGDAWANRETLTLAICLRATPDSLLGAIALKISEVHRHCEIGYWLGVSNWGRGYATEAARTMITYGFTDLGLHRATGQHFTRNPASGRVLQKLGMQPEGVHRDAYFRWGKFESVVVYGILASEWQAGLTHDADQSGPTTVL
jgi:[ribosomal protein S5]-alanine N-acetyltransferase